MSHLNSIIGQVEAKARLGAFVDFYKTRDILPGHVLFVGEKGMGQSALAEALAGDLVSCFRKCQASDFEIRGDFTAAVTNMQPLEVFFLEDLHTLKSDISRALAHVVEHQKLVVTIGQGPSARNHEFELPPFVLVATIPHLKDCPRSFAGLFDFKVELDSYSTIERIALAKVISEKNGFSFQEDALKLLVANSAPSPRAIETLMRKVTRLHPSSLDEQNLASLKSNLGLLRVREVPDEIPIDEMSGVAFEAFITNLIHKLGFQAEMTKASGDGGIDIVAHSDKLIVGGRYLFQCKRFTKESLVGAPLIREFYGAVSADKRAVKGVFVTTSSFTEQAKQFAAQVNIELIDGYRLRQIIKEELKASAAGATDSYCDS